MLRAQNLYESREEATLREEVLGHLDQVAKEWVRRVSEETGLGDLPDAEENARIYTFGSYRLGVHGPGEQELLFVICLLLAGLGEV